MGSPDSCQKAPIVTSQASCPADLPTGRPTRLTTDYHRRGRLPSCVTPALSYCPSGSSDTPPPHPKAWIGRAPVSNKGLGLNGPEPVGDYQLLHPFDYACRPRLRTRLTRGRRTWPRNPWSSSGGDSHSPFATHACILTSIQSTAGFPRRFAPEWNALLPIPANAGMPRLRWCA